MHIVDAFGQCLWGMLFFCLLVFIYQNVFLPGYTIVSYSDRYLNILDILLWFCNQGQCFKGFCKTKKSADRTWQENVILALTQALFSNRIQEVLGLQQPRHYDVSSFWCSPHKKSTDNMDELVWLRAAEKYMLGAPQHTYHFGLLKVYVQYIYAFSFMSVA